MSADDLPGMSARIPLSAGFSLAGHWDGPDHGPLVIMVHGGGQTRHSWSGTAAALGRHGYRVLSVDQRGHGESEWATDGDYETESFAADLQDVVQWCGRGNVTLIGASIGGLASLMTAAAMPSLVTALVLVDISVKVEASGAERVLAFMNQHVDGFADPAEASAAVAAYQPQRNRPANPSGILKNLRLREDGRYYWHWDPRILRGKSATGRVPTEKLVAAARKIAIPTLLVRGALSDVMGDASVTALQEAIPHVQVDLVEGAGHMVAGDNNAVFEQAILAFLKKLPRLTEAK